MARHTRRMRMQYRFDNLMSKGTVSLIGMLFVVSLIFIVITGAIGALIGGADGQDSSFISSLWASFNHTLDAGDLAGDTGSIGFIVLMAFVTIFGLLITSTLIGVISTGISEKIESLRKGHSAVIEEGHTIILGFNPTTLTIIRELVTANENQESACIVVMGDRDKEDMDERVRAFVGSTGKTKVICRSGKIDDICSISICSPETCKAIIVNAEDDYSTTKAVLACAHLLATSEQRHAESGLPFICAVARSRSNIAPMLIAGQGHAEVLYFGSIISKMMAQTLRRPGISEVFRELLSFSGDEIYFEPIREQDFGKTLGQINRCLPVSTAIGIEREDRIMLNPGGGTKLKEKDRLIVIAPDDGMSVPGEEAAVDERDFAPLRLMSHDLPRTILILGCNGLAAPVVREARAYASAGSRCIIAARQELLDRYGLDNRTAESGISLETVPCNIHDSATLATLMNRQPDNVLVLSDPDIGNSEADARVLMLLLQLSDFKRTDDRKFFITSELRDGADQQLAQVADVTDFVISSNITALMMAQVSESRRKRAVLSELLSSRGSEIYMKPAGRFVKLGDPVSFHTLKASAFRYGETAIGYKRVFSDGSYKITLNPRGEDTVAFSERDMAIVIAQDGR